MRFCGKQYGLLGALLLALLRLHGQQPCYYNIQQYGADDGFKPFQSAGHITEDRNGMLWIGTDNGLYQFDGKFFKPSIHQSGVSESLPSNLVQYNYQDAKGRYWVYVYTKGLYNFQPQQAVFTRFNAANEREFNIHQYELSLPFEDSRGQLWFSALGFGLVRYSRENNRMTPYKICPAGNCAGYESAAWSTKILEDPADHSFWLCSNNGLVHFFPETGLYEVVFDRQFKGPGSFTTFISGCTDGQGNIWLGTWAQGLKKFNRSNRSFETFLPDPAFINGARNICQGVAVRDSGSLWVSTIDGGLMIFNTATSTFSKVMRVNQTGPFISSNNFFQAANGTVWFCSERKLYKLNPAENLFPYYPFTGAGSHEGVNPFPGSFITHNGRLFIGAYYNGGLFEYDWNKGRQTAYRLPGGEKNYDVNGLMKYGGQIWVATNKGIYIFDPPTNTIRPLQINGLPAIRVPCAALAADGAGNVWIAGNGGLWQYHTATQKLRIFNQRCLPGTEVLTVACDNRDNVWIGMGVYGLGCLPRGDSAFTFFNKSRHKSYLQANCNSIALRNNGDVVYTLRGEGLFVLTGAFTAWEKIQHLTAAAELPSDFVTGVMTDRKQRTWIYSSAGISLLSGNQTSCVTFTQQEGLLESTFESTPWQDEDGYIYAGGIKGFQRFHADSILKPCPVPGRIYFPEFRINGRPRPVNSNGVNGAAGIRLGPSENNISFQFAALTTSFSNLIRYAYRLKGYDKDWIETSRNTVAYNNLPPGHYELQIKTGLNNQTWNTEYFSLPVIIQKPWYRQLWFTSLCILAGLLLLYGLYRFRIRTLKETMRMKTGYDKKISEMEMKALRAQMNPHFIFNCLNSINRYIVKSDSKTASGYLTKFSKLIRLILDNSAAETIPVEKEMETLRLYIDMEALRFDHVFDYSITTGDGIEGRETEIPSMLIQPYAENAIWHGLLHLEGRRGMLHIHFSRPAPARMLVTVEDNGIGREKAAGLKTRDALKRKSYGMQITSDRIHLINRLHHLNAAVRIEDIRDDKGGAAGTRVYIEIPVKE